MQKKFLLIYLIFFIHVQKSSALEKFQWAVVGAGLAGITTIAVLLEIGVDPSTIIWIDPEFNMGRMGKYYRNVPANTKIEILKYYFDRCSILKKFESASRDVLFKCDSELYPLLGIVVDPLLDATSYLQSQVNFLQDTVTELISDGTEWIVECTTATIHARKVVLAIGGYPKRLDYPLEEIPLDEALDKNKLAHYVTDQDSVAVFGGMHSAMLTLKNLSEIGVKQIVNFYTTPYFYRIPGAESLEGITREWVQNVLEKNLPENLIRIKNTRENLDCYLSSCNKVIYSIGFARNPLCINGRHDYECDDKTGIIAPNLYGIGLAFPHTIKTLKCGNVAINGFAIYSSDAYKLIPRWKEHV